MEVIEEQPVKPEPEKKTKHVTWSPVVEVIPMVPEQQIDVEENVEEKKEQNVQEKEGRSFVYPTGVAHTTLRI